MGADRAGVDRGLDEYEVFLTELPGGSFDNHFGSNSPAPGILRGGSPYPGGWAVDMRLTISRIFHGKGGGISFSSDVCLERKTK